MVVPASCVAVSGFDSQRDSYIMELTAMKRNHRIWELERAKQKGYHAALRGLTREQCPIAPPDLMSAWHRGWKEGRIVALRRDLDDSEG